MCDRMADESSTLEDIDTEEFVESLKNKKIPNVKHFPITRFLCSRFTHTGVFEQSTHFCDRTPQITHNHFYHSKKHNEDKYEPHTKAKQKRTDLFSADEIQMLYWRAKLGACKLFNYTLIFWIEKQYIVGFKISYHFLKMIFLYFTANVRSLVHLVWLNYSLNFGLRSIEEHVQMVKPRIKENYQRWRIQRTQNELQDWLTMDVRPLGAKKIVDQGNLIWGNITVKIKI